MPSASRAEVDGANRQFLVFIFGMAKTGQDIRGLDEDSPSYDPVTGAVRPSFALAGYNIGKVDHGQHADRVVELILVRSWIHDPHVLQG